MEISGKRNKTYIKKKEKGGGVLRLNTFEGMNKRKLFLFNFRPSQNLRVKLT